MNLEIKASIPRMRWLAALGSAGGDDAALMKKLDDVEKTIFVAARPKAIYRVMDRHDVKISRDFPGKASGRMSQGGGDGAHAGDRRGQRYKESTGHGHGCSGHNGQRRFGADGDDV